MAWTGEGNIRREERGAEKELSRTLGVATLSIGATLTVLGGTFAFFLVWWLTNGFSDLLTLDQLEHYYGAGNVEWLAGFGVIPLVVGLPTMLYGLRSIGRQGSNLQSVRTIAKLFGVMLIVLGALLMIVVLAAWPQLTVWPTLVVMAGLAVLAYGDSLRTKGGPAN